MREACPGLIINQTTGVVGPNYQGPLDCLRATRPEMAACNAGSLNYLKVRSNGTWAWPPMLFDNQPAKVKDFIDVMLETGTLPEFECFDVGIVRCVEMYVQTGMYTERLPEYNFVMGVESGMPADPDLLPILLKLKIKDAPMASHRHRPQRDLARAPARGGTGRAFAHGAGGHVLSAGRDEGGFERALD